MPSMTQAHIPTDWHPASWQSRHAAQQPTYRDRAHSGRRDGAARQAAAARHVVGDREPEAQLAKAQRGEAFLLQGGDCAESFDDCRSDRSSQKLKILLQMSLVLVRPKKPVIRVGRIAGQYAKPRSADLETRGDVTLPSYRGDTDQPDGRSPPGSRAGSRR